MSLIKKKKYCREKICGEKKGENGREELRRKQRELRETLLTGACTGAWSCVSLDIKYLCEDINLDAPPPSPPGAGLGVRRSKENSSENSACEPVLEGSSPPQNVFI